MKTRRSTLSALGGSLRRMAGCVRVLGIWSGWKYWRIGERARKDPTLVPQWAKNCRREAFFCHDEDLANAMVDWADELERYYARWNHDQAANAPGERPGAKTRKEMNAN